MLLRTRVQAAASGARVFESILPKSPNPKAKSTQSYKTTRLSCRFVALVEHVQSPG